MSENGFGNTGFREKVSIDQVYLRQLDRTNISASYSYETSVLQKLNNLPMSWRKWVLEQDERYVEIKDTYVYQSICGVKLGTRTEPCLKDSSQPIKLINNEIDWEDPNILSPKLTREPYTDYSKLDAIIMEASEYAGLTWNQETETFKIATIRLPLADKPTPYIPENKESVEEKEETPEP